MNKSVVTFGSCLSRRIAALMVREHGYKLESAVMQTKFTQYIAHRDDPATVFDEITALDVLAAVREDISDYDVVCNNISQQNPRVMGTFSSAREQDLRAFDPVIKARKFGSDDVLLLDTFADILFRSSKHEKTGQMMFANVKKMQPEFTASWKLQPYDSIDSIHKAIRQFCSRVRKEQPEMRIVLMNFPFGLSKSEDVQSRSQDLSERLLGCELLKRFGVEVYDLPAPLEEDCRPLGNYSHYTKTYYRNVIRMLFGQSGASDAAVIIGGRVFSESKLKAINPDLEQIQVVEQRLDTIVERDVWRSKLPLVLMGLERRLFEPFDLMALPQNTTIYVEMDVMLNALNRQMSVDQVGWLSRPTKNVDLMQEKRKLSIAKIAVMLTSFEQWVLSKRPDCSIVLVGYGYFCQVELNESAIKRLRALEAKLPALRVAYLNRSWMGLPPCNLQRFARGVIS
ncbi:hypothetical protein ACP3V3_02820 [Vibrio sp. PNB22_3_1]